MEKDLTPKEIAEAIIEKARIAAQIVLQKAKDEASSLTQENITDALQKRDIDELRKDITDGFKGVHTRQDTTNGRIAKAESNIAAIEKDNVLRDAHRFYEKLIWWLLTSSLIAITGLISYIFTHLK